VSREGEVAGQGRGTERAGWDGSVTREKRKTVTRVARAKGHERAAAKTRMTRERTRG